MTIPFGVALLLFSTSTSASAQPRPEMILQYFETSWAEVTRRIPEIAAAGYTAIWLPPPTKGAEGAVDVGFSVYDRFDLGDRDQRGTIATKYGTREEAVKLVAEAHRFGVKVYFDTVMNHNANPGKIENAGVTLPPVPLDQFPGTTTLDYHVLPARELGGGRWEVQNPRLFGGGTTTLLPNTREGESFVPVTVISESRPRAGFSHFARAPWIDFGSAGPMEEQFLSLLGLADFALEQDATPRGLGPTDGQNLVAEEPLPRYVRLPDRPETYPNSTPVEEDIREYMVRWIKWFGEVTDCDGLRLDAIKHVPTTFFARDYPGDPIAFNAAFQDNLDARRGSADEDDDDGRDDALLFGEAFEGNLDKLRAYRETGMFILDFPLLFKFAQDGGVFARFGEGNLGDLAFPEGGLEGEYAEFGGLGRNAGVSFVQSHDTNAPAAQPDAAHAFILSRVGHAVVFYDGNNANPATFVKDGRLDALGELESDTILRLLDIRRRFARGGMFNRYVDGDAYVYERVVATPGGTGGATLLVAITDNTQANVKFGEFDSRPLVVTEFPPGTVLTELTGQGGYPEVTVLDPSAVPAAARQRAVAEFDRASRFPLPARFGLVYLDVPRGPNGYVMYAPKTPTATLELTSSGAPLAVREQETAPARKTPAGAPVPPSTLRAGLVPAGKRLQLRVGADASAARAYVRVDSAQVALPGLRRVEESEEGLFDGFFELPAEGSGFGAELDLSGVPEGVHLVTVRVAGPGSPTFFSELRAHVVTEGGPQLPDGGVPTPPSGDPDGPDDPGQGPVDPAKAARLDAIVGAIIDARFDATLDANGDGTVDAVDFVDVASGRKP